MTPQSIRRPFRAVLAAAALSLALVAPAVAAHGGSPLAAEPQTVLVGAAMPAGGYHVGGGVILRANGGLTIATAAHVVQGAKWVTVRTSVGEELTVRGEPEYVKGHDIALLRTSPPVRSGLNVATATDTVEDGATLYVWGHPHSKTFVLSDAHFFTDRVTGGSEGIFALTCASCAVGDSGGGVFDANGKLLGIVSKMEAADATHPQVVIAEPIGPALAAAGIAAPTNQTAAQ